MIGIDLLEIERLERALERRPRLAERLFTDAERAYAAGKARPGQHLAARFCAKEAVAKALGLRAGRFATSRSSRRGPRRGALVAARPPHGLRSSDRRVAISLTHTRRHGGRDRDPGRDELRCPTGSTRFTTPHEMRACDAWAIDEQGVPSLDLMERAGVGWRALTARWRCPGSDPRRLRQGQQRRRRPGRGAAAARGGARGRRAGGRRRSTSSAATRSRNLDRLPGEPPRAIRRRAAGGLGRDRRRDARHRLRGRAARAGRRRDRGDQRAGAPVVACDVPSGVDASTGEVVGRRGASDGDGDLPRAQGRAPRRSGRRARGRGRGRRDRDPARRARRRERRPDLRARARPLSAAPARRLEVRLRRRRDRRRLARADRRADAGRAGGGTRRRRLRPGRRAGVGAADARDAPARGDGRTACRRTTARTRPTGVDAVRWRLAERAGARRARSRPRPLRRRRRLRARGRRAASRCRC